MTIRVKLASICCIVLLMPSLSAQTASDSVSKLAVDSRCARGLAWIDSSASWLTDQQIRLTEIPAPELQEAARAAFLKKLFAASGLKVRTDATGNLIAERPGKDPNSVILFAAHLDTVFPPGTDVTVKHRGSRLEAPGISDNGAGLAALVGLARALAESRVSTTKTIVLAGDVGEEGEGNLRGMRALVEAYGSRLSAVIAVDGAAIDFITTQAVASRRFDVTVTGPGGHSWSDFGVPNPIAAISRGIVRFSAIRVPENPRTSFNFGIIEGGTSVNSIPSSASVKVDLRSEDPSELDSLQSALRNAMQAGMKDEMAASRFPSDSLHIGFRSLGVRPGGRLPPDSSLLETIRAVDAFLGNRSRLEYSSTDANIPLSLGISAVAIGGGGMGGGSHTLAEWYDPTGRELGLKRLFLAAVSLAGLEP